MPLPRPTHLLIAVFLFAILLAVLPSAGAQTATSVAGAATPLPVYDVMTIKLNNTASGSSGTDVDDGRFSANNVSLKALLSQAYDIRQDIISGLSGPVESARFDVQAKVVDPAPDVLKKMNREQRRSMLLPLLTERFQLKTHIEIKTLPVYELVVAKGGPKFKPSAGQNETNGNMSTNGSRTQVKLSAQNVPIFTLAKSLSIRLDRAVIDRTGLTGNFDLEMQWSTDDNPESGSDPLPGIFTAIQEQLGLKLQPAKGPVETLIVDHAEMPTEN